MQSVVTFLSGKKTYIVAIVAAVLNLLVACGYVSPAHLQEINVVLGALGIAALRAGISSGQ